MILIMEYPNKIHHQKMKGFFFRFFSAAIAIIQQRGNIEYGDRSYYVSPNSVSFHTGFLLFNNAIRFLLPTQNNK